FYIQVKKFGLVRPILNSWHPSAAKITYWFPTIFVIFVLLTLLLSIIVSPLFLVPVTLYLILLLVDSSLRNKSIYIGILSIKAVFVQFFGYGIAFAMSTIFINFLKKDPQKQFPFLFFK
ncbi:MAG TPA: glycosyl transferase family 2, partial [Aequorivita sp.]|nr:glycosyl transferase family 2 [Aequorivita sp.]